VRDEIQSLAASPDRHDFARQTGCDSPGFKFGVGYRFKA
jgi:hypothetical protein